MSKIRRCAGIRKIIVLFFIAAMLMISSLKGYANPFTGSGAGQPVRPPSRGASPELSGLQYQLREKLADLMTLVKNNPSRRVIVFFFSAAFLYGILHAAGPGHRKGIIFAVFISKKTAFFEPFAAGFYSAALHAGSSVVLILFFRFAVSKTSFFVNADTLSSYLEGFTFAALGILAFYLAASKIIASKIICRNRSLNPAEEDSASLSPAGTADSAGTGRFRLFMLVTAASLFPCPGAMMLLLFSLSLDMLFTGIAGVIFMSLGMGLVISFVGFLARSGREGLFLSLKKYQKAAAVTGSAVEILSYSFLAVFSFWMAWPMLALL